MSKMNPPGLPARIEQARRSSPGFPALLLALLCLAQLPVGAPVGALEIVIDEGVQNALPIAIIPFYGANVGTEGVPDPARVIADDLLYSGSFRPIPSEDLPGRPDQIEKINFSDWQRLGTENLVMGRLTPTPEGGYQVEFRLVDIYERGQIAGMRLLADTEQMRIAAHRISNSIYQKLVGERGIFLTRIAYISKRASTGASHQYLLMVADYDGHRPQVLLESPEPLLSPAWSQDGERIAYVSFEGGGSTVYVQEVRSGERTKVSALPGINGAPDFSPQDDRLALTLSRDGNSEIYILHLASGLLQRITNHPSVDTEPTWFPDGERLVFTSDRSGRPQLYEVQLQSGATRRLTFEGEYHAGADVSPDGKLLAMVYGAKDGGFRIAVQELESGRFRVLSNAQLVESPSFSPNGRMLVYAARDGELSIVSVNGGPPLRRRSRGEGLREPAWAPFPAEGPGS